MLARPITCCRLDNNCYLFDQLAQRLTAQQHQVELSADTISLTLDNELTCATPCPPSSCAG